MKIKSISKILKTKCDDWIQSITDASLRAALRESVIITGGCIPSMLAKEKVNDFDIYFTDLATTKAIAEYYVALFGCAALKVDVSETGRVRLTTPNGYRGETKAAPEIIDRSGAIEDAYEETEALALGSEDDEGKPKYRPVFLTTNAITLSNRVQLVLRFYGAADEIHANYDFVHCTNYWTGKEEKLVLRQPALESLLSKELRYVGSKYPVCSIIRLRKFIARGWTINAGQILKMLLQIVELDLKDPKVLEDQLTGVDSAFFVELIQKINDKDPQKINTAYLVEIIDRIF